MADITVTAAKVNDIFPSESERITGIASEAVTAGQAVYITSTGTYGVADANAAGKQQIRGIAMNAAAAGGVLDIMIKGYLYGFTFTQDYGAAIFLSDTAGALADAAGTMTVNVGRVFPMADGAKTKVLKVDIDWLRTWS